MADSEPDLSEFFNLAGNHPDKCVIARSMDALDGRDLVNLTAAMNGEIGHRTISRWLKMKGQAGSEPAVKDHRTGKCCCAHS